MVAARQTFLGLQLSHKLHDESLGVLLMLRVAKVQVSSEVLIDPGGQVVAGL